jgi:hypothetical protein
MMMMMLHLAAAAAASKLLPLAASQCFGQAVACYAAAE